MVSGARADEIRLKDGKKLYGVIVAYEDNMFKVKTDFGFVLVEKDKIAAIIPTGPSGAAAPKIEAPTAKKTPEKPEVARPAPAVNAPRKKRWSATPAKTVRWTLLNPAARPKISAPSNTPKVPKAAANATGTAKPAAEKKSNSGPAVKAEDADASAAKTSPAQVVRRRHLRCRSKREIIRCTGDSHGDGDRAGHKTRAGAAARESRERGRQHVHQLHPRLPHVQAAQLEIN